MAAAVDGDIPLAPTNCGSDGGVGGLKGGCGGGGASKQHPEQSHPSARNASLGEPFTYQASFHRFKHVTIDRTRANRVLLATDTGRDGRARPSKSRSQLVWYVAA